jgi:hypothetical protein
LVRVAMPRQDLDCDAAEPVLTSICRLTLIRRGCGVRTMKLVLNVSLAWLDVADVYVVGFRGLTVGKVWCAADRRSAAMPWEWLLCLPMTLPDDSKGVARSKNEALQRVADSLHELILWTPPDRLDRAFLLAAAAELYCEPGEMIELSVGRADPRPAVAAKPAEPVDARPASAIVQQATSQPRATSTAPQQTPGQVQTVIVRKRSPTLRVKLATADNGGAAVAVTRPLPVAAGLRPTSAPAATDVRVP